MAKTVSVVVPSFNQGCFLPETLESLLAQEDPALEILVVDGGSNDETPQVLERYRSRLTVAISEPDAGQSDAINKGFARARGEWLAWLNSDDLLQPGATRALRAAAAADPGGRWFAGGGSFIDERSRTLSTYSAPGRRLEARDLVPWTSTWFGQPGTFFRRDLFEAAGGAVRTDLRYAMDLDLWLRLGRIAPLNPIAHPMGCYRLHGGSKTVAERHRMECEVVQVLWEQMGMEAALSRVSLLAEAHFEMEARMQRLGRDLRSPLGWLRILRRRLRSRFTSS